MHRYIVWMWTISAVIVDSLEMPVDRCLADVDTLCTVLHSMIRGCEALPSGWGRPEPFIRAGNRTSVLNTFGLGQPGELGVRQKVVGVGSPPLWHLTPHPPADGADRSA